MEKYLREQIAEYPFMQPQDVYKLCYQAAFGAEHLLQDKEAAKAYYIKEFEATQARKELLYEQIGEEVCRCHIGAWKQRGLPVEWLFEMFAHTAQYQPQGGENDFYRYLDIAGQLVKEGCFAFTEKDWTEYGRQYQKQGLRAVHHSELYRDKAKPAYRLICHRYIRLLPVLEYMVTLPEGVHTIAIDGRCASGKTTMAQMLADITGAGVVHMDDFFLPAELRSRERLQEAGGNVHYERFREEVIPQLTSGDMFSYRRFQCSTMSLGEDRIVTASRWRIVEGAYSCHPYFGDYADIRVFADVLPDEQLRRIRNRDGEKALTVFQECWIPMEEKYFSTYKVKEKCNEGGVII